jgi:hypothetical protein
MRDRWAAASGANRNSGLQVGALGKYYYGWRRKQILRPSREVEQQQPWLDEYIVIECWNWQARRD